MKKILFIFICLLFFDKVIIYAETATYKRCKVNFVDEAQKDNSFFKFRIELLEHIEKKDVQYLLSITDKNIIYSFGDDDGIKGFVDEWKIFEKDSKVWDVLKEVINSGGRFEGEDIFFAPYTFTEFLDDYDVFEYNIVKGENRKVYLKPDRNSYVLGILSNEVIKINNETEEKIPETWSLVTLYNGKKGYILSRYLKSPIDFRVGFIKKKGVWKMNCFVEGD